MTSIGYNAFGGCSGLTNAVFVNPDGWQRSDGTNTVSYHSVPSEELADPTTVATQLTRYSPNYLKRT